jgi:hypothetical protein
VVSSLLGLPTTTQRSPTPTLLATLNRLYEGSTLLAPQLPLCRRKR